MNHSLSQNYLVAGGLEPHVADLEPDPERPNAWSFRLSNGKPHSARAALDGDWLSLTAPLPDPAGTNRVTREAPLAVLKANGGLNGGSRIGSGTRDGETCLRTDLWLGNRENAYESIAAGCVAFADDLAHLSDPAAEEARDHDFPHEGETDSGVKGDFFPTLIALGEETGWQPEIRGDRRLVVPIDIGRGVWLAGLQAGEAGRLRGEVTLVEGDSLGESERMAIARLLLTAGTKLRIVRPALHEGDSHSRFCVEFVRRIPTDAVELDLMLSSLAVACWICGLEARALSDGAVAHRYLESLAEMQATLTESPNARKEK